MTHRTLTRRAALRIAATTAAAASGLVRPAVSFAGRAMGGPIVKPLPRRWFYDYGTQ